LVTSPSSIDVCKRYTLLGKEKNPQSNSTEDMCVSQSFIGKPHYQVSSTNQTRQLKVSVPPSPVCPSDAEAATMTLITLSDARSMIENLHGNHFHS
jgi:hypothetical protein